MVAFKHTSGDFFWCLQCQRAYLRTELRFERVNGTVYRKCHYNDCDGNDRDACEWTDVRRNSIGKYPEIPEHGVRYPVR